MLWRRADWVTAAEEEWDRMMSVGFDEVIDSMPRRIQAVILANGGRNTLTRAVTQLYSYSIQVQTVISLVAAALAPAARDSREFILNN